MARTGGPICAIALLAMANPSHAQDDPALDLDLPPVDSVWQLIMLLVNLDEVVETVAFYTCLMAVLVMLLGLTIALRQREWSAYSGLVIFGLVWIAFNDQNLSGIHWSGIDLSPRGLVTLGYVMASCNFLVAAWSIPPGFWQHRLKWPLVGLAVACWATWPLGRGLDLSQAMLLFNITAITCGIAHAIPFSTFTRLDGRPDRLLRRAGIGIGGSAVTAAALVSAGLAGADVDIIFINRVVILVITAFLCLFFALRIRELREDREAVIARSLADARREAQINRDLLAAQREHATALEIARLQRMRLAEASHDIRQPITSLRSTMAALTARQPAAIKAQLDNAFDYLDQLAASYMDEARSDAPIRAASDGLDDQGHPIGTETVSTALLAQTLDSMFRQEAEAAGHALRVEAPDIAIDVAPLATLRILSNLLSNAIQHGTPGPIRLGVRDEGGAAVFEIANRGALPPGDVFAPFAKGEESAGQGLGLSIVRDLASQNGLSLTHHPDWPDQTMFRLSVPLAGAARP